MKRNDDRRALLLRLALAAVCIAVVGAAAVVSLRVLTDADGAGRLIAGAYDGLGMGSQADAIRDRGMQPVPSVLVILGWSLLLGTVGIWAVLWSMNAIVDAIPARWRESVRPYVYLSPAYLLLTVFLIYPLGATIWLSLTEDSGPSNFTEVLGNDEVQRALINNLIWLVVATGGSVLLGLIIAQLLDRVRREALAKTFVFLPLALSMVGASVIWRFMYLWRPEGRPQIGVVNAVATSFGADPIPVLQDVPINTLALIAIMIWLQTGFAMVILSAAIKGVPDELLEAARLDGANEFHVFTRIIVPMIRPSIVTVTTTIAVAVLKVFDIVFVMTGGKFETEVIANRMFAEMFKFRNFGRASAIAVILFVLVLPVMWMNLRNFRRQELMR